MKTHCQSFRVCQRHNKCQHLGLSLIYEVEGAAKTSVMTIKISFLLHKKTSLTWRTLRKYCPKWQRGCGWQSKLLKRCQTHSFLERYGGSLQGIWTCLVGNFNPQKQTCPLLIGRCFYGNGNLIMLTRSLVKSIKWNVQCRKENRSQVSEILSSSFCRRAVRVGYNLIFLLLL